MAKPNYNFAKRQKEAARKARQDAKLARRKPKPESDLPSGEASEAQPLLAPKPGTTT